MARRAWHRATRRAFTALFFFAVSGTVSAAGFVSGARVSKAGDLVSVTVTFSCNVSYLGHDPVNAGDQLRIQLEPNSLCRGVAPQAAITREQLRPAAADDAKLVDIEYDGTLPAGPVLKFRFGDAVRFGVEAFTNTPTVMVRVYPAGQASQQLRSATTVPDRVSRRVPAVAAGPTRYVINLQSSDSQPAATDLPALDLEAGQELFVTQALINGVTWYRIRLGYFPTAEVATRKLASLRADFPGAWIDRAGKDPMQQSVVPSTTRATTAARSTTAAPRDMDLASLMSDARRAMTAGELAKAVQIYTKVLQQPESPWHPQAQEFLALARERNGQLAHAKAEYERYLDRYPDNEDAARVRQRLAALISRSAASGGPDASGGTAAAAMAAAPRPARHPWTVRSFVTQYYRRDVNQVNENNEVIAQSALYSDINLDARRRGERFDLSTRISGGYRYDFLGEDDGSGNDFRLSYAYADLADARIGLSGRLGRQSRNSGGVLGRFDGVNLTYHLTEHIRVETVAGKPVNSVSDGVDDARTFYGLSSNVATFGEKLDLGVFLLQQDVETMTDRQAVGTEMRYFDERRSLWAMVDYDTAFDELGSLFVQGSLRLPSETTLSAVVDRRRSPFLSASNALIGQPVSDFDALLQMFTEEEIRQLALDRAAKATTLTLGVSHPVSPKLQINVNASESMLASTPDSAGISGTPESTYLYVSTDLIASSLLTEGDVSIIGVRYADSEMTQTWSLNLDARFPIGSHFRVNPRVQVSRRDIVSDGSIEWSYTPGLRLQYRKDRRFRIDVETGLLSSSRKLSTVQQDRKAWFVNLGYQFIY